MSNTGRTKSPAQQRAELERARAHHAEPVLAHRPSDLKQLPAPTPATPPPAPAAPAKVFCSALLHGVPGGGRGPSGDCPIQESFGAQLAPGEARKFFVVATVPLHALTLEVVAGDALLTDIRVGTHNVADWVFAQQDCGLRGARSVDFAELLECQRFSFTLTRLPEAS